MSNLVKICSTCKASKPLTEFWKDKKRKDGLQGSCIDCLKVSYKPKEKEKANRDAKNYAQRHPERVKANFSKWYSENRDWYLLEKSKKPLSERMRKTAIEYLKNNRDEINNRRRERRKNMSPKQKLEKAIRDRFYKVIIRMKKGVKLIRSFDLLGCTIEEFKTYLESKFHAGMNWSNHGNGAGKWNIDHVVPLVKFDLFNIEDQKKSFHYTNLQPLWFEENMKKARRHFN